MGSRRKLKRPRGILSRHPIRNANSAIHNPLSRRLHVEALEDRRLLAVLTVDSPLDNFDPVSPTTDGQVTLREALLAANADAAVGDAPTGSGADVIEFDFGHDGPETILLTRGELVITSELTVNGPGAELLTIDASGSDPTPDENNGDGSRVFKIESDVTINRLTLTGGDIIRDGGGGAIRSQGTLILNGVTVRDNATFEGACCYNPRGGGIDHRDGKLTITDSTITGNSTNAAFGRGGGISADNANVEIKSSTISGNATSRHYSYGAGIAVTGGSLTVTGSTISDNNTVSDSNGGGIWGDGTITVTNSTISGNVVPRFGRGGGIYSSGILTVIGSTISGNSGGNYSFGGGIGGNGNSEVVHSTISGNSATYGGGIHGYGDFTVIGSTISGNSARGGEQPTGGGIHSSYVSLTNSIVANNNAGRGPDLMGAISVNYSLIGDTRGSGITEETGIGNILDQDPLLGPLADNGGPTQTHALLLGSPAIDAGDPSLEFDDNEFDQRGEPFFRVQDGKLPDGRIIDTGAYERQDTDPRLFIVDTLVDENDGDVSEGDVSLREAIDLANRHPSTDTIEFAPTLTSEGPATILLTINNVSGITIQDSITINGPGPDLLTIDASGTDPTPDQMNGDGSRVFTINGFSRPTIDVHIGGLSITGGDLRSNGGGINNRENLTLTNVTIRGNSTIDERGGGIYSYNRISSDNAALTVVGSTISGNSAAQSGGGIDSYVGAVSIRDSVIVANYSGGVGGGISTHGGYNRPAKGLTVISSRVIENSAGSSGGGISSSDDALIRQSEISGNSARVGGGIRFRGTMTIRESTVNGNSTGSTYYRSSYLSGAGILGAGELLVSDSTISNNVARRGSGGGILMMRDNYAPREVSSIVRSTITGNTATDGAGIYMHGGPETYGDDWTLIVESSIIAGNDGTDVSAIRATESNFESNGYNLIGQGIVDHFDQPGDQVIGNADPLLGPLADNGGSTKTHALLPGSPAIDAGDPSIAFDPNEFDQRGVTYPRVADGVGDGTKRIDIGAFEVSDTFLVDTLEDENDGDFSPGDRSLREAIERANSAVGRAMVAFDPALTESGPATILLSMGELVVANTMMIDGPGAEFLTIDAGNGTDGEFSTRDGFRLFNVDDGDADARVDVTIRGLTLTGADVPDFDGGAIRSAENLVVADSIISGNAAFGTGGGIASRGGNLTVSASTISDNVVLYRGGGIFSSDGNLEITLSTIDSNSSVIGGAGVFHIDGGVTVVNSAITNNTAVNNDLTQGGSSGGGIDAAGGSLTLIGSIVSGNSASSRGAEAGGIHFSGTEFTVVDSTISGNSVSGFSGAIGGGISTNGDVLNVFGSTIHGNSISGYSPRGGGIANGRGEVNITASTVSGNTMSGSGRAEGGGGASDGAVNITHSMIEGNSMEQELHGYGGGIFIREGTVNVAGSTISGNSTPGYGGAIYSRNGEVNVRTTTISGNSAGGIGGGIVSGIGSGNQNVRLTNSIVANNSAAAAPDLTGASSVNYSLIGDTSDSGIDGTTGTGNILNQDPLLGPLADNGGPTQTHALILGSPAIDAGDPSIQFDENEFDQRGEPFFRVQDGKSPAGRRIDIGAYERQEDEPRTFIVDTLADESDGDFSPDDFSLREAIESSNLNPGPDAILFDAALTSDGAATITLVLGELPVSGALTIEGPGAELLTIDAAGNDPTPAENNGDGSRVFHIDDADNDNELDVTISGLTLTGGDVTGKGGAIRSLENLVLEQSTITGNATSGDAGYGGGVFTRFGDLTVTGSTVTANSTSGEFSGGAGIHSRYGNVTVTDTVISGNFTLGRISGGVGIFILGGDLTVTDSTISDNVSHQERSSGGGIFSDEGEVIVTRSTISRNSTLGRNSKGAGLFVDDKLTVSDSTISHNHTEGFDGSGGGIQFFGSEATISGSTISGNFTTGENSPGGAISAARGAAAMLTITSSTITGNFAHAADSAGGGIFASNGDQVTLVHTIVAGNDAVAGPDVHRVGATVAVDYSLIGDTTGSGITPTTGTGNILNQDPLLGPLMDNGGPTPTHALLPTSPAIDAGDPSAMAGAGGVPLFDQRGEPFHRVVDGDLPDDIAIDIGAYERQQGETFTFIVDTPEDESDGDFSTGNFSLREAIELANLNPGADAIQFDFGHDGPETILLIEGELAITDWLAIDGFDAHLLTIDAQQDSRIFNIDNPTAPMETFDVSLTGLTLTGGRTTAAKSSTADSTHSGGAIRSAAMVRLTVDESTLTDNHTAGGFAGGGAIFTAGPLTLTGSVVSGNSTIGDNAKGGGIEARGNVTVTSSTLEDNHTHGSRSFGGGLYGAGSDTSVRASTISANSTTGPDSVGGGLAGVDLTLIDSTVHGNSTAGDGSNGGGVWAYTASITQSTISGNRAMAGGTLGGGVRTLGDATITHSTITENHATQGGGVFVTTSGATNLITGSIIAGNTANTFADLRPIVPNVVFYSLIGDTSDFTAEEFIVLNIGPGNLLDVDPRLDALTDNGGPTPTHALLPESPAIDAGDPSIQINPSQFDQRGEPFLRVVDGNMLTDIVIDMGAYESQGIPTYAPGDFNEDGVVGPADYPVWRDGLGTIFTEGDYDVWKAHYGDEWQIIPKSASGSSERSPAFLFVSQRSTDAPDSASLLKSRASSSNFAVAAEHALLMILQSRFSSASTDNPSTPLRDHNEFSAPEPLDEWFAELGDDETGKATS